MKKPIGLEFGKHLKNIRLERKLTIRQVEAFSGVSNAYLSQLETGKRGIPSPEILHKLAPVYKVPYQDLMRAAGYLPDNLTPVEEMVEILAVQGDYSEEKKQATLKKLTDAQQEFLEEIPDDEIKEFAQQFAKLRKKAGYKTIDDLAKAAGVWSFTIKRIESGKNKMPSPPILEKLAKPLGIEPEELFEAAGYFEYKGGWVKALDDNLRPQGFDELTPEEQQGIKDQIDFLLSKKKNKL